MCLPIYLPVASDLSLLIHRIYYMTSMYELEVMMYIMYALDLAPSHFIHINFLPQFLFLTVCKVYPF